MKLHILSDVHLEFAQFDPPDAGADVVVLAGDVHVGRHGLDWARDKFHGKTVIAVPGNHEHYGHTLPRHIDRIREHARAINVHFLENEAVLVGDVLFLGCTLWTDFELFSNPSRGGFEAMQRMADYRRIRVSASHRHLHWADTVAMHRRSLRWLHEEVERHRGKKIVIVTHHAPSLRSVPLRYRRDPLSAAFASSLDTVVEESGACLWVHGHTHGAVDYTIGGTRIICNPRGYPDEVELGFNPVLVVDV